jgi:hypothetical protein
LKCGVTALGGGRQSVVTYGIPIRLHTSLTSRL